MSKSQDKAASRAIVAQKLAKERGATFEFGPFSITFVDTAVRHQKSGESTIGAVYTDTFVVKDAKGAAHSIGIQSGQNLPQPTEFAVAGKTYTIRVYVSSKGEGLYPDHFEIVEGSVAMTEPKLKR